MVLKKDAYICEKCGYYEIGRDERNTVKEHEAIPERGNESLLEGLIVRWVGGKKISVFGKLNRLSQNHEALYNYMTYDQSLEPCSDDKIKIPKFIGGGFTAQEIIYDTLHYRDLWRAEALPPSVFKSVRAGLMRKYPSFYTANKIYNQLDLLIKKTKI
jgi:hypothetical protein